MNVSIPKVKTSYVYQLIRILSHCLEKSSYYAGNVLSTLLYINPKCSLSAVGFQNNFGQPTTTHFI